MPIETQAAYEWHVPLDPTRAQTSTTSPTTQQQPSSFISAFFLPAKSLNEHFYNKKVSIIDLKTTKTELFVIDGNGLFIL